MVAFFVDDADAIAVTVEAYAEVCFGLLDFVDEIGHVVEFFRICFVVGEIAVRFAEKFDYFCADFAEELGGEGAGGSVPCVDYDFEWSCEFRDEICEFFEVGWPDRDWFELVWLVGLGFVGGFEIVCFDEFEDFLEFVTAD